jgi:hypothetical protein
MPGDAEAPWHDIVGRFHRAMEQARLDYVLVGRSAAALWGATEVREEVDALVRLEPGGADKLLAAAKAGGFDAEPGLAALAVESGEHLSLFSGPLYVDVKPARGASDLAALRTRVPMHIGPARVWAATLEETVARLLDEGTEASLEGARRLLRDHGAQVDAAYLGQRCEELGVAHLLREVQAEALAAHG